MIKIIFFIVTSTLLRVSHVPPVPNIAYDELVLISNNFKRVNLVKVPKCDASVMLLLLKVYRTVSLPVCHCLIDNPLIKLFNIKKVRRKGTCIVSLFSVFLRNIADGYYWARRGRGMRHSLTNGVTGNQ